MGYCDTCCNTGWIDCHCGGDLCVCLNYGELPCPACDGMGGTDDDEDYYEHCYPPDAPSAPTNEAGLPASSDPETRQ